MMCGCMFGIEQGLRALVRGRVWDVHGTRG